MERKSGTKIEMRRQIQEIEREREGKKRERDRERDRQTDRGRKTDLCRIREQKR